jgi:hypothetical protein
VGGALPDDAFSGCVNLTSVTLSDELTSLGKNAFYNCSKLTGIKLPDTITTIPEAAFANSGLQTITLSDNVRELEKECFSGCSELTSIELSDNITTIPEAAFASSGLTEININYGVTEIGASAFQDCDALTKIAIPVTVSQNGIGDDAFLNCDLNSITCPCTYSLNKLFKEANGIVPNDDNTFKQECIGDDGKRTDRDDTVLREFHIIHDWSWRNTENHAKVIATDCRMDHFQDYEDQYPNTPLVELEIVQDSEMTEISGSRYYKATRKQTEHKLKDTEDDYLTEGNVPPIVYYQDTADPPEEMKNPVPVQTEQLTRLSTPDPCRCAGELLCCNNNELWNCVFLRKSDRR